MEFRPKRLRGAVDYQNGPNPSGICMCGCGERTTIAKQTISGEKAVAGKPKRYVQGHRSQRRNGPDYLEVDSGCWIWQGGIYSQTGYGIKYCPVLKGQVTAHRWYYESANGPIPAGFVIDHLCHPEDGSCLGGATCIHRRCVNPKHLGITSNRKNILRGVSPPAKNATKTHCVNGHQFSLENTYFRPDRTGRQCRTCKRNRDAEYVKKVSRSR